MIETSAKKDKLFFEGMLIAVVCGIALMAAQLGQHKLVVLNLFFLPIILNGYFLGRGSSCNLALLAVLAVTVVSSLDPGGLTARYSPLTSGLALSTWAATLGLAAILVGTLCDERGKTVEELHQAYVGVVEVLSKYLQGGQPNKKARSTRIAELSQKVAEEMNLSRREIDDIRVAALLSEIGDVEITTNLAAKAVDTLESSPAHGQRHTFAGLDLAQSLSEVLHGAVPLLLRLQNDVHGIARLDAEFDITENPLGATIIQVVRDFDHFVGDQPYRGPRTEQALEELSAIRTDALERDIIRALEHTVKRDRRAIDRRACLT